MRIVFDDRPVAVGQAAAMSDAELMRMHAVREDDLACAVLYQRHHSRLLAVATRIAGAQDADDAVQDGCLRAYQRAGQFRGDSAVTTWLHRIVVNAAFDLVRRSPLVAEIPDEPRTDPELAQAEARLDLQRLKHRLSPDHQAALLLVDVMGYPIAEAAALAGVSEGCLKSRAARARKVAAGKLEYRPA